LELALLLEDLLEPAGFISKCRREKSEACSVEVATKPDLASDGSFFEETSSCSTL